MGPRPEKIPWTVSTVDGKSSRVTVVGGDCFRNGEGDARAVKKRTA